MERFVIKHLPTNKVYCEDEGGSYLLDESKMVMSWGERKDAEDCLLNLAYNLPWNGLVITEDGDYPIVEFQLVKL